MTRPKYEMGEPFANLSKVFEHLERGGHLYTVFKKATFVHNSWASNWNYHYLQVLCITGRIRPAIKKKEDSTDV